MTFHRSECIDHRPSNGSLALKQDRLQKRTKKKCLAFEAYVDMTTIIDIEYTVHNIIFISN
jgi:hypothetical protein